eukprot:COSAG01_NODE_18756_length_1055_cov_2.049163_2_plen_94_part_00
MTGGDARHLNEGVRRRQAIVIRCDAGEDASEGGGAEHVLSWKGGEQCRRKVRRLLGEVSRVKRVQVDSVESGVMSRPAVVQQQQQHAAQAAIQ